MAQQTNAEGQNVGISWTDYTANAWEGCTKVHAGCDNCYAETICHRWGKDVWGNDKPRRYVKSFFSNLNKYQKEAAREGRMKTVFVGSMMDVFEKPMPMIDGNGEPVMSDILFPNAEPCWPLTTGDVRRKFFRQIEAGIYPNLLFLLLTKRPSNINKYIPEVWLSDAAPDNVMFGTSVVNQETADKLIPQLLEVKGNRFLSMEPLLGPVDLDEWISESAETRCRSHYRRTKHDCAWMGGESGLFACEDCDAQDYIPHRTIDWVIVGGESGPKARPMRPEWAQSIQMQCAEAGVKFHFKQWGEWIAMSQAMHPVELADGEEYSISLKFPDNGIIKIGDDAMVRSGKKANGRLLDGKEYNALATD